MPVALKAGFREYRATEPEPVRLLWPGTRLCRRVGPDLVVCEEIPRRSIKTIREALRRARERRFRRPGIPWIPPPRIRRIA